MNKKIWIIGTIVGVVIILVGSLAYFLYTSNGKFGTELQQKGKEVFGTEYCNGKHDVKGAGDAFTNWKCTLCGKEDTNPDTNVPEICANCARITGRCMWCGKLEKQERK